MRSRATPLSFRRILSCAVWVAAVTSALGCEPRIAVDLLDVTSVESERIDAGHRLSVAGHRFLLGHTCAFVLRGTWHRPGARAVREEHTIWGEARSGELAEATVSEEIVRELGGRATFVGDLEVRFDAASIPGGIVRGTLGDVTLDFVPAARGASRAELAELERSLGARFAEPGEDSGAEVADVEPGGLFASLGLEPGDRIVSRGHLRVIEAHDLDLADVPIAEHVFGAARGGETFVVRAARPDAPAGLAPVRAHQLAALLVVLGLALGLSSRPRRARGGAVRLAGPAHIVITVALALALQRGIALGLVSDVSILVGAGVLAIGLTGAGDASGDRAWALVTGARALAFAAVVLAAAALAGTTDLTALSARAAGDPSRWPGLGTALGPAAALGLVVSCTRAAREERTVGAGLLDALVLGLAAATATAVLFGGAGAADPASAAAFVLRTIIVASAIAIARSTLATLAGPVLAALGVTSTALSAAGAYLALVEPLDASSASALAETVAVAVVLVLGLAVGSRVRAPLAIERELEV